MSDRKIMAYKLITGHNINSFMQSVDDAVKQGWQPWGTVVTAGSGHHVLQVLVAYQPPWGERLWRWISKPFRPTLDKKPRS